MISIIDYACSACLFFIIIIVHRGLYLALHCRGHFNSILYDNLEGTNEAEIAWFSFLF